MEFYCVKCDEKVELEEYGRLKAKNGAPYLSGKCPKCGRKVCKFISRKAKGEE